MNTLKRIWCAFMLISVCATSFTSFNIEAQSNSKLQNELEKQRTKAYKKLVQGFIKQI